MMDRNVQSILSEDIASPFGIAWKNQRLYMAFGFGFLILETSPQVRCLRQGGAGQPFKPYSNPPLKLDTKGVGFLELDPMYDPPFIYPGPALALVPTPGGEFDFAADWGQTQRSETWFHDQKLIWQSAIEAFLKSLPTTPAALVKPMVSGHWELLEAVTTVPAMFDLLSNFPSLASGLAQYPLFNDTPKSHQEIWEEYAGKTPAEIAAFLGFDTSDRTLKILRAMHPDSCDSRNLLILRDLVGNEAIASVLAKVPELKGAVFSLLGNTFLRTRLGAGFIDDLCMIFPNSKEIILHPEGRTPRKYRALGDTFAALTKKLIEISRVNPYYVADGYSNLMAEHAKFFKNS